jgi:hypothetical protein
MCVPGRIDPKFDDHNEDLIRSIVDAIPDAKSMEMETYVLYHLANACKEKTFVSAAAIVVYTDSHPCSVHPVN